MVVFPYDMEVQEVFQNSLDTHLSKREGEGVQRMLFMFNYHFNHSLMYLLRSVDGQWSKIHVWH